MMKTNKSLSAAASVAKGIHLVLLLTIGSAFALVGLNEETNNKIYGQSIGSVPWDGSGLMGGKRGEIYRISENFSVVEVYDDNAMSVGEMYIKSDGKEQFTEKEAIAILVLNSLEVNYQWKKIADQPLAFAFISDESPYKDVPLEQMLHFTGAQQDELMKHQTTKMIAVVNVKDGLPNFLISKLKK